MSKPIHASITLTGQIAGFAELAAIATALQTQFPTLDIGNVYVSSAGELVGSIPGGLPVSPIVVPPTEGEPAAEPEQKTRRARAKKDEAPAAGPDAAPQGSAVGGTIVGPLKAEAQLYFHVADKSIVYTVQKGEPIIQMPGAVAITEERYNTLRTEYDAKTDQVIAQHNDQPPASTAGPSDAKPAETEAAVPTAEECRMASGRAIEKGMKAGVVALVKALGVDAISKIPEGQRAEFIRQCNVLSGHTAASEDDILN